MWRVANGLDYAELESVSKQHVFARGGYYGAYFMAPYRYDIRSLSLSPSLSLPLSLSVISV